MKQTEINNTKLLSLDKAVKHGDSKSFWEHLMTMRRWGRRVWIELSSNLFSNKEYKIKFMVFYSYFTYKLKEKGTTLFSVIVNY